MQGTPLLLQGASLLEQGCHIRHAHWHRLARQGASLAAVRSRSDLSRPVAVIRHSIAAVPEDPVLPIASAYVPFRAQRGPATALVG